MKTIKEMSEEYLEKEKDEIVCIYDRYAGFVDGAIYVLNQIEEWLRTTDYTSYKPAEHDLWVLIEQLKN